MTIETNNIVSLTPRRSAAQFTALTQVEAYWEGLRNGRVIPSRSDIDPRGMQSALEYAFILERIAPGVARFRLAGMHLTDLMGMEVRGMPLTALFNPSARTEISSTLEAVFQEPQITTITLTADRGIGRPALEAKLLLCPLKSDLGDVNRVLGCLQSIGEVGRQPRRFNIGEIETRALLGDDTIQAPVAKKTPTETRDIPGLAEHMTPKTEQKPFILTPSAKAEKSLAKNKENTRKLPENARKTKVPFLSIISND